MSLDELAARVIDQVHECIGCNDCMLACPLEETARITIGELNAAVMAPALDSEPVIAFVSACTQCQQCVPVCPADLSRADMVLFNKLKLADSAADKVLLAQVGARVAPSEWRLDALCQHLAATPMLDGIGTPALRRMILASTLHWLAPDEVLVAEDSFGDRLHLIVRGRVAQTARLADGSRVDLVTLAAGDFVGEMGALADRRDPYGLVARSSAEVLSVPRATVLELDRTSPAFRATLAAVARERAMRSYAARSALLGAVPEAAREALIAAGSWRTFAPGEVLIAQSGTTAALAIVQSGFFRVSARRDGRERTLFYLREGDDHGAMFALHGEAYTSDVAITALTRGAVLEIPLGLVRETLVRHPEARAALIARATAELALAAQPVPVTSTPVELSNASSYALDLSALLGHGVMSGHEVLAIDLTLCTDCNNCVDACGRRHGTPRLERSGLQLDHILFPAACRHCDDPVCLLCSVNGIVRRPGGEISIIDSNCIGCGACAERCPYDNISMQPRDPPKPKGLGPRLARLLAPSHTPAGATPFGRLLDWLRGPPPDVGEAARVAVKCDLCAGYQDQACVVACPTGAAARIDPTTVFSAKRLATMGGAGEP